MIENANLKRLTHRERTRLNRDLLTRGERLCTKCKHVFPLTGDYFYESRKGLGGFESRCKKCFAERARISHQETRIARAKTPPEPPAVASAMADALRPLAEAYRDWRASGTSLTFKDWVYKHDLVLYFDGRAADIALTAWERLDQQGT